ncbi:MAG: type II toxin-antitoxin system VapC family toxin [Solirubrobacterales bacterium]
MILDTSAVIALIQEEEGSDDLIEKLSEAGHVAIGAPSLVEATVVLVRRFGPSGRLSLDRFIEERDVISLPFDYRHWRAAQDAFMRFGKGRHAAGLNLGDCMSYATARVADEPLLFVGDDFARTDIAPA